MENFEGKMTVKLDAASGNIIAHGGNYILNASKADIANYAREGADLVVEFTNGQRLTLRDFFLNGTGYNSLALSDGSNMQIVDFSHALNGADGINDGAVFYSAVAEGGANGALLGLLGLAAAGAGIAAMAGGSGSDGDNAGNNATPTPTPTPDKKALVNQAKDTLFKYIKEGGNLDNLDELINIIRDNINLVDIDNEHQGLINAIGNADNAEVKEIINRLIDARKNGKGELEDGPADTAEAAIAQLKKIVSKEKGKITENDLKNIKSDLDLLAKNMDEIKNIEDIHGSISTIKNGLDKLEDAQDKQTIVNIGNGVTTIQSIDKITAELEKGADKNVMDIQNYIADIHNKMHKMKNIDGIDAILDRLVSKVKDTEFADSVNEIIKDTKALKALDQLSIELESIKDTNGDGTLDLTDIKDYQTLLEEITAGSKSIKDIEGTKAIVNEIHNKMTEKDISDIDDAVKNIVDDLTGNTDNGDSEGGNDDDATVMTILESLFSGDEASADNLFASCVEGEFFDVALPIAPLALEDDFAASMAAASQIII